MSTKEEMLERHVQKFMGAPVLERPDAESCMDEWAEKVSLDFARFLEEHTEIVREEKITLYRYCDSSNEWGNYTLEDIFIVFKEKYDQ